MDDVPSNSYNVLVPPISRVIPSVEERSHIGDADSFNPRCCPLCQATIRLFFINFNEKMVMCENTECDYPFGVDELQFYKVDGDSLPEDIIINSHNQAGVQSSSNIQIVEKYVGSIESMKTRTENAELTNQPKTVGKRKTYNNKSKKELEQEISNQIKELNIQIEPKPTTVIKNKKLLESLMGMQGKSKKTLINPIEMQFMKEGKQKKEIKIDLKTDSSQPVIVIDIDNNT